MLTEIIKCKYPELVEILLENLLNTCRWNLDESKILVDVDRLYLLDKLGYNDYVFNSFVNDLKYYCEMFIYGFEAGIKECRTSIELCPNGNNPSQYILLSKIKKLTLDYVEVEDSNGKIHKFDLIKNKGISDDSSYYLSDYTLSVLKGIL